VCGCGCCDGTPLSATCAPYYPGCLGSGSITTPNIPVIPNCPLMSSYDSISGSCKCFSGYVSSGGRCISNDQLCTDKYGFNAQYDILKEECKCRYGFVWNSSGTSCISGNQACWNKYGYNSTYDNLGGTCKCSYGFVFNDSGTKCISNDDYCQDKFGFGSSYDILHDQCKCKSNYKLKNNTCVLDLDYLKPPTSIPLPTLRPTIWNTPKPILKKLQIPTIGLQQVSTSNTGTMTNKPKVKLNTINNKNSVSLWSWLRGLFK
jgi:hypothetical protein